MNLGQINNLTKTAYDKTALKYHGHFKDEIIQKDYDRHILDEFSSLLKPESLICDAGCGPSAHIGRYLAGKGHKVIGIDISPKCIEIASEYNPKMEFRVMDMMKTDFSDNLFDGIISYYSIIYTPKKYISKIFSEFHRILRKKGKLLVAVKKGPSEGIIDDQWYEGNKVYFSQFIEDEIKVYFIHNNFELDYIDTREPYSFEIQADRIYAIGTKFNRHPK